MTTRFVDSAATFVTGLTEADAHKSITGASGVAASWAAGDIIRVKSTHNETTGIGSAGARTFSFPSTPGLQVLSVAFDGSGTGALTAGATIDVGAANAALTIDNGFAYCWGITWAAGTNNNSSSDLIISTTAGAPCGQKYENCTFNKTSTTAGSILFMGALGGSTNDDVRYDFTDCTFNLGGIPISPRCGTINLDNMALTGTAPTSLFLPVNGAPTEVTITASDLSGVTWTNLVSIGGATYGYITLKQCKLPSGFVVTTGTIAGPGNLEVVLLDCDSGDNHYKYIKTNWSGTITASNSIYRGATNGTDSFSLLMAASANASFTWPLVSPDFTYFNDSLVAMTSTVAVTNDGTTFKDNELWQETLAKITSGSTKGTWNVGDRAADILNAGTNQDTSTAVWTGTGGFGAEVKQALISTSFTPAEVGAIAVRAKLAKASASVYVSPKVYTNSNKQWLNNCGTFINETPQVLFNSVIGG